MYSGDAAENLADKYKVERVENNYFDTQKRFEELKRVQLDISFFYLFFFSLFSGLILFFRNFLFFRF